jgi:hypothetical protein
MTDEKQLFDSLDDDEEQKYWQEKKIELQKMFPDGDLEWRISQSGITDKGPWAKVLVYITNRAIMQRLDNVFGVNNWRNEYRIWRDKSQICTIYVWDKFKREWITKEDGADNTNFESTKGGLSDSMKRASYQWGIGRYLYNAMTHFAEFYVKDKKDNKQLITKSMAKTLQANYVQIKDKNGEKHPFYWIPPEPLVKNQSRLRINMIDKEGRNDVKFPDKTKENKDEKEVKDEKQ